MHQCLWDRMDVREKVRRGMIEREGARDRGRKREKGGGLDVTGKKGTRYK